MCSLYHYFTQRQNKNVENLSFKEVLLGEKFESGYRDALWHLEGVQMIGRFERLQKDLDWICKEIGIGTPQLVVKNDSKHDHYRKYYDQEMIDYVARTHKNTIEAFRYDF